ncbi:MAG: DUF1559 domain-containing protein [Planctomycetes bacterium]|nr:DUF1559 domain-containing protein [Planctomycetota bacterium]
MADPFRYRLTHLLYVTALLCASLAALGMIGIVVFAFVAATWLFVFWGGGDLWRRPTDRKLLVTGFIDAAAVVAIVGIAAVLLYPEIRRPTAPPIAMRCRNNLKQIGMALHAYHDDFGSFPPAFVSGPGGEPMHSWRVLILPYIECQPLFELYDFDEPWDGPKNRRLHAEMPDCYRCLVHDPSRQGCETRYFAVVGAEAAWPGSDVRRRADFLDEAAGAIFVVESPQSVNWMAPDDLSIAEAQRLLTTPPRRDEGLHVEDARYFTNVYPGRAVLFGDGAVFGLPRHLPTEAAASALRIPGGDPAWDRYEHFLGAFETSPRWAKIVRFVLFVFLVVLPYPWTLRSLRRPSGSAPK